MDYQRPNHTASADEEATRSHDEARYLQLFAVLTVLAVPGRGDRLRYAGQQQHAPDQPGTGP